MIFFVYSLQFLIQSVINSGLYLTIFPILIGLGNPLIFLHRYRVDLLIENREQISFSLQNISSFLNISFSFCSEFIN